MTTEITLLVLAEMSCIVAPTTYTAHFAVFGLPGKITGDKDPKFVSVFTQTLYDLAGCRRHEVTPHYHHGLGQAERTVRTVRQYLRTTLDTKGEQWLELLPAAQYAFNTSWSASTG